MGILANVLNAKSKEEALELLVNDAASLIADLTEYMPPDALANVSIRWKMAAKEWYDAGAAAKQRIR